MSNRQQKKRRAHPVVSSLYHNPSLMATGYTQRYEFTKGEKFVLPDCGGRELKSTLCAFSQFTGATTTIPDLLCYSPIQSPPGQPPANFQRYFSPIFQQNSGPQDYIGRAVRIKRIAIRATFQFFPPVNYYDIGTSLRTQQPAMWLVLDKQPTKWWLGENLTGNQFWGTDSNTDGTYQPYDFPAGIVPNRNNEQRFQFIKEKWLNMWVGNSTYINNGNSFPLPGPGTGPPPPPEEEKYNAGNRAEKFAWYLDCDIPVLLGREEYTYPGEGNLPNLFTYSTTNAINLTASWNYNWDNYQNACQTYAFIQIYYVDD